MKIGIDARMFSTRFTGIGRCTFELTKRFFELRPDWQWVLWMNQPEFDAYEFPSNVKKVLVNAKHYSLAEQTRFWRMIEHEKCDLVHFMHFNVPFLYRKKYIATIHDLTLSYYPGYGTSWLKKFVYKRIMHNTATTAAHLVAVSENTKKDLMQMHGVASEKITRIYNGIDLAGFTSTDPKELDEIKKEHSIGKYYLFYAGNWKQHKNVPFLVKTFAGLAHLYPDLQLVLTGKADGSSDDVEALVKELNIETQVICVGYVSEEALKALYTGAVAFVFPTLYEGFGLPALEAMAVETPVITSDRSSLPEVCGDAALYFDPENEDDFAAALQTFLDNSELAHQLVEKGEQQVKKFDWDTAAQQFLEVYEAQVKL
jgi:glycosyltransferase involved in cell wall biosynthesis